MHGTNEGSEMTVDSEVLRNGFLLPFAAFTSAAGTSCVKSVAPLKKATERAFQNTRYSAHGILRDDGKESARRNRGY